MARSHSRAAVESDTAENVISTVSVIQPKRASPQTELDLPGNISAFEEAPIYARVSGYLKRWHTDIGTRVNEGDLLAVIENAGTGSGIENRPTPRWRWPTPTSKSPAFLPDQVAKLAQNRSSVSQQDTDVKVATWHAQQANVDAQAANVQRLKELSNFKRAGRALAGIITIRTMDAEHAGSPAGSSREIFRLAKIDPLRVYVSLPQAYSQMVKTNDEADLTLSELPGQSFAGRVDRTAGAIDPVSRTLLTEILVSNRDGRLLPGAHTMVRLKLAVAGDPMIVAGEHPVVPR